MRIFPFAAALLTLPAFISNVWSQTDNAPPPAEICIARAENIADTMPQDNKRETALSKIILAKARRGEYGSIDAIAYRMQNNRDRVRALLDAINYADVHHRNKIAARDMLQVALTSTNKISEVHFRDNLLWQIVYYQALNGQIEDARNTTQLIESLDDYDHALYQIAAAQAEDNNIDAARATASSIRPGNWRENAFSVVAGAATRVGNANMASKSLAESRRSTSFATDFMAEEKAKAGEFEEALALARKSPRLQVFTLTRIAEQALKKGNSAVVKVALAEAHNQATKARTGFQLHDIAIVQARAGLFDDAFATISDLEALPQNARSMMNGNDVVSALTRIAEAQSKAGRSAEVEGTLNRAYEFLGKDPESHASLALLEIIRYATITGDINLAHTIAKRIPVKVPIGGPSPTMAAFPITSVAAFTIIGTEQAKTGNVADAAATITTIDEMGTGFADEPRQ